MPDSDDDEKRGKAWWQTPPAYLLATTMMGMGIGGGGYSVVGAPANGERMTLIEAKQESIEETQKSIAGKLDSADARLRNIEQQQAVLIALLKADGAVP